MSIQNTEEEKCPLVSVTPLEVGRGGDSRCELAVYEGTVAEVLGHLGLYTDMRATFNDEEPGVRRYGQLKDSGLWWRCPSQRGELRISVDVGCWHDHDCCGCICGLTYTIKLMGDYVVVLVSKSFNY